MRKLMLALCAIFLIGNASAQVELPAILGNDMVLQCNTQTNIWGKTGANKKVVVTTSWNGEKYNTTAGDTGNWSVAIATPDAGGPYEIKISDGKEIVLTNILIGEVWVCSGQSNMQMDLRGFRGECVENSLKYQLEAPKYPNVRLFTVTRAYSDQPQEDCEGVWKQATPGNAAEFSAVAWFFGITLSDVLVDVPIGLIASNWGGTLIEPWMSPTEIARFPGFQDTDPNLVKMQPMQASGVLYNAMIAPLVKSAVKGFIWYQGESNRHNHQIYDKLMHSLVKSWREAWKNDDMPFYFVEIAPYRYEDPNGIDLPLLIEAQHRALDLIPKSGIAGTADVGDSISIHPPRKYEVGMRLALNALAQDYGIAGINFKSPVMEKVEYGEDGKVSVAFANAPIGFIHKECLAAFEVAGADRKFYPAKARTHNNSNIVEITCDQVSDPVAVRYGFHNWYVGDLFSADGLPALPFRTDNWDDVK